MTFAVKRYRIRAWGSPVYPDLNYQSDDYPHGLMQKYPCTDVAMQHTVSLAEIRAALDK